MKVLTLILFCICSLFSKENTKKNFFPMTEKPFHPNLLKIIHSLHLQEYKNAEQLLNQHISKNSPAYPYFKGLIAFVQFKEVGIFSSLDTARYYWQTTQNFSKYMQDSTLNLQQSTLPLSLYQGFAGLQLSYISALEGNSLSAALQGRKNIQTLRKNIQYLEAQCAVHTYEYYKAELLKPIQWLPFMSDLSASKQTHLNALAQNCLHSEYFSSMFLTSLAWMLFEEKRYEAGLSLIQSFLNKYPNHRIYREIKADFLYKQKKYSEALVLFQGLEKEYEQLYVDINNSDPEKKRRIIPIAYWSVIGNLTRVHHKLGNSSQSDKYKKIWFSNAIQDHKEWLPKSLQKSLEKL